ncbi:MAG: alpha/beta fold hydrolase [Myxococcota bacterium]
MHEIPTVLLHGFGGSPEAWRSVIDAWPSHEARPLFITPRQPGHGAPIDTVEHFEDAVNALAADLPDRFHLVGYSLGGRLALGLVAQHPSRVVSLTLIGAHPGLDASARPARQQNDLLWAQRLQAMGTEAFFESWIQQPLFASQRALPAHALARQKTWRQHLNKDDLARAMRVLSLSTMPDYRPMLPTLTMPILLMAGEQDAKFVAISESMMAELPHGQLEIVKGVGHNIPLEAPDAVAQHLARFIGAVAAYR